MPRHLLTKHAHTVANGLYCADSSPVLVLQANYFAIPAVFVSKTDLEAGTLYHLRGCDYPLMVQMAAEKWLRATVGEREQRENELRKLLTTET